MGASVGDLDLDGIPDVFIGNGGPASGQHNQLFLSRRLLTVSEPGVGNIVVPVFEDMSDLIDFPLPEIVEGRDYPSFPYRTHGTCITDFDGDGRPELAIVNGGPAYMPDFVREPNRMFKLTFESEPNWLKIWVEGDGEVVHRDAFHTRLAVTTRDADGSERTIRKVHLSANGFSVQNGREVLFGLGPGEVVTRIEIVWPNGETEVVTDETDVNQLLHFVYAQK
jgi:hypothetical protein